MPVVPVYNYCTVNNLRFRSQHGMEEVIGSIPIRSTNQTRQLNVYSILNRSAAVLAPGVHRRLRGRESYVWYIDAMMQKSLPIFALLLAITPTPVPVSAQATGNSGPYQQAPSLSLPTDNPGVNLQTPPLSSSTISIPQGTSSPTVPPECDGLPCDYPLPRITDVNPPPAPESWPLRDRITWSANVVLAIVGYFGIILAVSTLKKIERHTRATEVVAEAAADSAQAALLNAQAVIDSGRPWLLITVEPSRSIVNSFTVKATNRGRCPAYVIASVEQIMIAVDEAHLPQIPEYTNQEPGVPFVPMILLPGESTAIKSFSRDDLKSICPSEEMLRRIENWEEKVFIYGNILYRDLIAPADKQTHETNWCCWYIHGRQKSGLVIAGPSEYNLHT